ncbi:hypothetical protein LCGC14_0263670 [marine sediment metagenome]|uniref:Uncharacterized protein n=1 Tax=marine sediment metagenome TaxID=412755 RepID=A0A0F9X5J3_9ZZZZ
MKIITLAGSYTPTALADYFVSRAEAKGLGDSFTMKAPLVRGYAALLKNFDNNRYLLVCATDRLIAGEFIHVVGVTGRLLTTNVFNRAVIDLGGYNQPWKYMYYERFSETAYERFYFAYWMGLLEDVRNGYNADEDPIEKLNSACDSVDARLKERGALEEWPEIEGGENHPEGDETHCDSCWVRYAVRPQGGLSAYTRRR